MEVFLPQLIFRERLDEGVDLEDRSLQEVVELLDAHEDSRIFFLESSVLDHHSNERSGLRLGELVKQVERVIIHCLFLGDGFPQFGVFLEVLIHLLVKVEDLGIFKFFELLLINRDRKR